LTFIFLKLLEFIDYLCFKLMGKALLHPSNIYQTNEDISNYKYL